MSRNATRARIARRALLAWIMLVAVVAAADFPQPYDSEASRGSAMTATKACASMKLPDGFRASLFAAEPHVRQPIAMCFDTRGRLWVAENYTYAENHTRFDTKLRDRILIFADTDHDGAFDERSVFWDQGVRVSSVEVGFGGVWVLCPPQLLFIPDANRDDLPDGEPQVVLDGWNDNEIHHCLANGLRWGPDGWLYGRQGIQGMSRVGAPGAGESERVAMNGGIWRYHPIKKTFEVVCRGTTNPWGMDWDEHGQAFFINTVIGHLWHVIPGAHYERMYGQDPEPNLYSLIPQTADHFHWDTRDSWEVTTREGVSDGTDQAGGGHAHAGLLIYQGDNWPAEYRGEIFTLNLHGRRINRDHPARHGATYTAAHRPDMVTWADTWFRGIDLITGPDGAVYVADWSDTGECHEADGVHRSSGRVYKITYGAPSPPTVRDVATLSDEQLVALQRHRNTWYARQAQRVLQERAAAGQDLSAAREALIQMFAEEAHLPHRLRAMWCLHVTDIADEAWLLDRLDDPEEHVRTWAVTLLADPWSPRGKQPSERAIAALGELAARESSGLVLTFLAAALQRMPVEHRWPIAASIAEHDEFGGDPVLPRMLWYALEPAVAQQPLRSAELLSAPVFGPLQRHVARRLAQESDRQAGLALVIDRLATSRSEDLTRQLLLGLSESYAQERQAPAPPGWTQAVRVLASTADRETAQLVRELSVLFGDAAARDGLLRLAANSSAPAAERRDAIRMLARFRPDGAASLLHDLVGDEAVAVEAIRALAALDDKDSARLLLERYETLSPAAQAEALAVLASRQSSAVALLKSIAAGKINVSEVPAFLVRQLRNYDDPPVPELLSRVWPVSGEASPRIAALRASLTDERLARADAARGRSVYEQACGQCHRLFGEGGDVGPELTGAQRNDLGYLLENIISPSATLAREYRMVIFTLADGRVLNGRIAKQNDQSLVIQTANEQIVVAREEIEEATETNQSLMPEGLLDNLNEAQIADLVRYLQSPRQAPLAEAEQHQADAPEPAKRPSESSPPLRVDGSRTTTE